MKPTQTSTARESITITLTPQEQDLLLFVFGNSCYVGNHVAFQVFSKLSFLQPNIGDACRHSAHIPEAPGQGGN